MLNRICVFCVLVCLVGSVEAEEYVDTLNTFKFECDSALAYYTSTMSGRTVRGIPGDGTMPPVPPNTKFRISGFDLETTNGQAVSIVFMDASKTDAPSDGQLGELENPDLPPGGRSGSSEFRGREWKWLSFSQKIEQGPMLHFFIYSLQTQDDTRAMDVTFIRENRSLNDDQEREILQIMGSIAVQ